MGPEMNNPETPCRESFVFYRSFNESIRRFPDDVQLVLFRAVADYGLDRTVPDFSGVPYQPFVEAIFAGIRPQLEANWRKWENGCTGGPFGELGGAPKGNQNARKKKQPQNNPKTTPNDNVNVNENANGNITKGNNQDSDKGLTLPFQDPEFVSTWNELRTQPRWKGKTTRALAMALKQLSQYHVRFAVLLMQNAIAGNYQGVVSIDTPAQYARWKQNNPTADQPTPGMVVGNANDLY